jgi:hypothetical protein
MLCFGVVPAKAVMRVFDAPLRLPSRDPYTAANRGDTAYGSLPPQGRLRGEAFTHGGVMRRRG